VSGNPRGRGLVRDRAKAAAAQAKAEAAEDEAERLLEVERLLTDLGRSPSYAERLLIDEFAALAVQARRFRKQGKAADGIAMLMTRLAGKIGIKANGGGAPHVPLRDRLAGGGQR
jgi:hypothetical protein